jgi:hypothetical protein
MYSTTVYLYQQITPVLLVDTSGGYFTRRYDPVYAKSLTINKGVDNVLLFEFINQDQKPVNIIGSTFVFRLINQAGDALLLAKDMEVLSAATGRVKVTLSESDTVNLTAQPASYSIERTAGSYVQAAYVDDNAGARGTAVIVDSIQPQHLPSSELTIPTTYGNPTEFFPPQLAEYFSSEVEAPGYLTTFQMYLDVYTGTIKFQGQDFQGINWTDASDSFEYVAESGWHYFTVTGHYSKLRIAFDNRQGQGATADATVSDSGVVTSIAVTAPGTGYQGAARITIVGNGSGAQATSTVNGNGGIGSITVTSGGSGYTPIQIQNTVRANVVIDAGSVTSISYR